MTLYLSLADIPDMMKSKESWHKIVMGEAVMMQIVTQVPQHGKEADVKPHRHQEEQIAYLLTGECELETETSQPKGNYSSLPSEFQGQPTEKKRLKAPAFFRIPSGALHSLKIIGDEPVSWISAYDKVRPTYVPHAIKLDTKECPSPYK